MYVHVKPAGEIRDAENADPLALVNSGQVGLVHSECGAGKVSIEGEGDEITLVCGGCQTSQGVERAAAVDALRRVLAYDEYAWGGDVGFLPD